MEFNFDLREIWIRILIHKFDLEHSNPEPNPCVLRLEHPDPV